MKILKRISNVIVWTIIGLYIFFFILSSLPPVQAYMGEQAAKILAKKLGTNVTIGRVDVRLFGQLTLNDVDIEDQQGEDMLWCGRISARLDLLPLMDGKISIAKAQLFSTHARIYQATENDKLNCQFLIDSLASKDTTSHTPLDLRIQSLIIRHTSVSYDCLNAPKTPGVLNPKHLWMKNISAHIVLKALTDDSLNINVKRLTMNEQSGLEINRLAFHYEGGKHSSLLEKFVLRMPGTNLQLGDIKANYRFRGDHFVTPALTYEGSIRPSTITLADLACLLPSLKTFHSTLSLEGAFDGQGETLNVPHLTVSSTTGDIGLDIKGTIKNLRQEAPAWMADIQHLDLSGKTINFISENLKVTVTE